MTAKTCVVKWCAALASEHSDYCAVHQRRPSVRPEELAPGAKVHTGGYHWKPVELVKWPWGKAV